MLSHGGGGDEMQYLINDIIFEVFDNEILKQSNDSAILNLSNSKLAFTTDSFVVTPRFFNGGNIGKIAVCGTINDLLMVGAKPLFLSCGLIIEEGFDIDELKEILKTMKKNADLAGVKIVCGDTKVVPKNKCDGIFINTSGIGEILQTCEIKNLEVGAKILLSGDIGRHGAVILALRDELALQSDLKSDCKNLNDEVLEILNSNLKPLCMRDATRGGLSAVLNEWAKFGGFEIDVFEEKIKVSKEVQGVCELLGFEPFELANEGSFVLAVKEDEANKILKILQKFNKNANIIGEIIAKKEDGFVTITNEYGSKRFLESPKGELLPRIC